MSARKRSHRHASGRTRTPGVSRSVIINRPARGTSRLLNKSFNSSATHKRRKGSRSKRGSPSRKTSSFHPSPGRKRRSRGRMRSKPIVVAIRVRPLLRGEKECVVEAGGLAEDADVDEGVGPSALAAEEEGETTKKRKSREQVVRIVDELKDIYYQFGFDLALSSIDPEDLLRYVSQDHLFRLVGLGETDAGGGHPGTVHASESIIGNLFGDGINVTVIAYGQIGSGKTVTMFGEGLRRPVASPSRRSPSRGRTSFVEEVEVGPAASASASASASTSGSARIRGLRLRGSGGRCDGLVFQFASELFSEMRTRSSRSDDVTFELSISVLEVYQETIRDLINWLNPDNADGLRVREDPVFGPRVEGLAVIQVRTLAEATELIVEALRHRVVSPTLVHEFSSRGHCVVTFYLKRVRRIGSETGERIVRLSCVDMAGMARERTDTPGTHDENYDTVFRERKKINLSCTHFGLVIDQLIKANEAAAAGETDASAASRHVNYRDSKLTWLLREAIGDVSETKVGSKTVLVGCIAPSRKYIEETLSTLRFCSRARRLRTFPKVVQDANLAVVVQDLREQLLFVTRQLDRANEDRRAILHREVRAFRESELDKIRFKFEMEAQKLDGRFADELNRRATTIKELKAVVAELSGRRDEQSAEIEKFRELLEDMKARRKAEASRSNDAQLALSKGYEGRLTKYQQQVEVLSRDMRKKQRRESELLAEITKQKNQLLLLKNEFDRKKGELTRILDDKNHQERRDVERISKIEENMVLLEGQLAEKNDYINRLLEQIKTLKLKNKALSLEIERLKTEMAEMTTKMKEFQFENEVLERRLSEKVAELGDVEAKLKAKDLDHERELQSVEEESAASRDELLRRVEGLELKGVEKENMLQEKLLMERHRNKQKMDILKKEAETRVSQLEDDVRSKEQQLTARAREKVDGMGRLIERLRLDLEEKDMLMRKLKHEQSQEHDAEIQRLSQEMKSRLQAVVTECNDERLKVATTWSRKIQDVQAKFHEVEMEKQDLEHRLGTMEDRLKEQVALERERMEEDLRDRQGKFKSQLQDALEKQREEFKDAEDDLHNALHDAKVEKCEVERRLIRERQQWDQENRRLRAENRKLLSVIENWIKIRGVLNEKFDVLQKVSDDAKRRKRTVRGGRRRGSGRGSGRGRGRGRRRKRVGKGRRRGAPAKRKRRAPPPAEVEVEVEAPAPVLHIRRGTAYKADDVDLDPDRDPNPDLAEEVSGLVDDVGAGEEDVQIRGEEEEEEEEEEEGDFVEEEEEEEGE